MMKNNKYIDFKLIQAITGNVYQPSVEYVELLKENNFLKEELRLWVQMYYEIIKVFEKVIPISKDNIQNSIDKQNTLLSLSRDLIKSIDESKFINQNQLQKETIKEPPSKPKEKDINPEIFLRNKPYVEQLQPSQLTDRLHDIDKILSKEIDKNRKYIPNSNTSCPKKLKKKRSSSSHKKNKPLFPPDSNLKAIPSHEKRIKNEFEIKINKKLKNRDENQNAHTKMPSSYQRPTKKRKNNNYFSNKNDS